MRVAQWPSSRVGTVDAAGSCAIFLTAPIRPRKRPQFLQKIGVSSRAPSAHSNVTARVAQFEQMDSKAVAWLALALIIILNGAIGS